MGDLSMYSNISHKVGTYPEGNKGGLAIVPRIPLKFVQQK